MNISPFFKSVTFATFSMQNIREIWAMVEFERIWPYFGIFELETTMFWNL
jgi:hypothetical protein